MFDLLMLAIMKRIRKLVPNLIVLASLLLVGSSSAIAQSSKNCLSVYKVNELVKSGEIVSFAKIKKIAKPPKGAKIFGQRLCQVDGRYVYFFKVVDPKGNARGMALRGKDGKPHLGGN